MAEMDNEDSFLMGLNDPQFFNVKSVGSETIPTYTKGDYEL